MGTQIASYVSASNGFPNMSHCQVSGRSAAAVVQRSAPGATLFSEGDAADCVFEVVSGTLRLYKAMADGRRQITGFVSGGQLLGLSHQGSYMYTAEAVTPLTLRRYQRPAFERRIDEEPGLARRLLSAVANELRIAQDQMLLLGRKSAAEKVASFLLALASNEDGEVAEGVELPMGRGDIADYLGLTVETVSRTFTKLRNDGLIALPNPSIVEFLDVDQLEDLASGATEEDSWIGKAANW